jgi:hypothetical protein
MHARPPHGMACKRDAWGPLVAFSAEDVFAGLPGLHEHNSNNNID